jgi:2-polyprenyl-6-methoxyphenol hydroxylase-like FAD-dependent oxidoreductase
LHGRTLRILEKVGLAERLRSLGHEVTALSLHVPRFPLVRLELPSPALALPQPILEEALLQALRDENVEIRSPQQAVAFEQHERHVDVRVVQRELVTLGSPAAYSEWEPVQTSVVRASVVIGADGYDSRVRAGLGIESVRMGGTETFAMFEAKSAAAEASEAHLCFDEDSSDVMLPLPGGVLRWGFQVSDRLDEVLDLARLHAFLSERAPWFKGVPAALDWGTVIHFERQLARCFGRARVWLAGDAAHVTSPLGHQSMNAGLSEAYDLGARLANAVHSGDADSLEAYGLQQVRDWHKLLGVNVGFDLLPHAPPWLATHARQLVPALPASGPELTALLERIGLRLS